MKTGMAVRREGTKVVVEVEHGLLGDEGCIKLEWEACRELLADALATSVQNHLAQRIQAVRRQEYELGWRDAKAKRTRRTSFFSTLFLRPE